MDFSVLNVTFILESLLRLKGDPFLAEQAQKRFLCSSLLLARSVLMLLDPQKFDFA